MIEAFQMTQAHRKDNSEWPLWLHQAWDKERGEVGSLYPQGTLSDDGLLSVGTLEGRLAVAWDDWITQEDGELSLCKPDIFAATYEPV